MLSDEATIVEKRRNIIHNIVNELNKFSFRFFKWFWGTLKWANTTRMRNYYYVFILYRCMCICAFVHTNRITSNAIAFKCTISIMHSFELKSHTHTHIQTRLPPTFGVLLYLFPQCFTVEWIFSISSAKIIFRSNLMCTLCGTNNMVLHYIHNIVPASYVLYRVIFVLFSYFTLFLHSIALHFYLFDSFILFIDDKIDL